VLFSATPNPTPWILLAVVFYGYVLLVRFHSIVYQCLACLGLFLAHKSLVLVVPILLLAWGIVHLRTKTLAVLGCLSGLALVPIRSYVWSFFAISAARFILLLQQPSWGALIPVVTGHNVFAYSGRLLNACACPLLTNGWILFFKGPVGSCLSYCYWVVQNWIYVACLCAIGCRLRYFRALTRANKQRVILLLVWLFMAMFQAMAINNYSHLQRQSIRYLPLLFILLLVFLKKPTGQTVALEQHNDGSISPPKP
jgi:hypothetical protein